MKNIIFYVYDEKELKTWVDLLAEHDIDWCLSTVRNKRDSDMSNIVRNLQSGGAVKNHGLFFFPHTDFQNKW